MTIVATILGPIELATASGPETFARGERHGLNLAAPVRHARSESLERVKGIEPSYAAWEAAVLPLNYTRMVAC